MIIWALVLAIPTYLLCSRAVLVAGHSLTVDFILLLVRFPLAAGYILVAALPPTDGLVMPPLLNM